MNDTEIKQYLENYYKSVNPKHIISQSQIKAFKLGVRYATKLLT